MYYEHLAGALEALLFAAGEPLPVARIAEIMQLEKPQVWELITALGKTYEAEDRGLMLREIAEGYQLVTKPVYIKMLSQLCTPKEIRLSNAALETLAIVAFRQPVTRSEIEAVRGVKADGVVGTLLDLGLIAEAGRKKALGNPILFITTDKFLTVFGLRSLQDLRPPAESGDALSEYGDEQTLPGFTGK